MPERDYGQELRAEIDTWGARLRAALVGARAVSPDGAGFLRNVRAYESDAAHFLGRGDLVRSFESLVWAWAWLEIGHGRGLLEVPDLEKR